MQAKVVVFYKTEIEKSTCTAFGPDYAFERGIALTGGLAQPSQPRASKWAPRPSRYPSASSCAYWRLLLVGVLNRTDDS